MECSGKASSCRPEDHEERRLVPLGPMSFLRQLGKQQHCLLLSYGVKTLLSWNVPIFGKVLQRSHFLGPPGPAKSASSQSLDKKWPACSCHSVVFSLGHCLCPLPRLFFLPFLLPLLPILEGKHSPNPHVLAMYWSLRETITFPTKPHHQKSQIIISLYALG